MSPADAIRARARLIGSAEKLETALIEAYETPGLLDDPKSRARIQALLATLQKELEDPCSPE